MIQQRDFEGTPEGSEHHMFGNLSLLANEAETKGNATLVIPEKMAAQHDLETMEMLVIEALKLVSEARFQVHCLLLPNDSVQLTVHAEQPDPLRN